MRASAALILLLGVAAAARTSRLRALHTLRPAEEATPDVDDSSADTDVPVEVEDTDSALPSEDDKASQDDTESQLTAEHNDLIEELEKSKDLKRNLAQTSHRAQQALEEFHEQEKETKKVESRLEDEERSAGQVMDELNKVGHKMADANRKLQKTQSLFKAEQRKNGELMDELRAEQFNAQREEQNQVAKEHAAMEKELQNTKQDLEQARAHEAEMQKKMNDLEHAKDLWKSAAVSARKALQDQKAAKAKAAKVKVGRTAKAHEIDHATLGEAVEMAHASETDSTQVAKPKRVHKEVAKQFVPQEPAKSNAATVATKGPVHVEQPVVQVADDASSEYGEDDISIISQADDPPLEEEPHAATNSTAATLNVPAVQSKSDSDVEEDEEVEEEE
eukprot:gnl/MRDRNA2_/MRDRNA2_95067_c0_seq1.p1 gnl/MRDRNA2_/MRDRNA2_95067_c0~~gnl/MRDRNA2_/MRDRNA2_95067_c0_seq1.p1  ORF type:complete len:391 (+),score=154.68 gnl/MRDRNA2_/MRDRNA2_95067_c0_seq1:83-1255(+)